MKKNAIKSPNTLNKFLDFLQTTHRCATVRVQVMAAAETAGGEDILADSGEPALGRVAEADLHAFCLRIGLSKGLSDDSAAALADVLVDADARG